VVEEKPVEFKIEIQSTPANAKLYIDGVYTHHWTPSNERELKDVMDLLTVGKHTIKVTKAGMEAEKEVTIVEGDNGVVSLILEVIGLPPTEEEVPLEEVPEVEVPTVPVVPKTIKALFADMMDMTEGRLMITRTEVEDLKIKYGVD